MRTIVLLLLLCSCASPKLEVLELEVPEKKSPWVYASTGAANSLGWQITDPVQIGPGNSYTLKVTNVDKGRGTIDFFLQGYKPNLSSNTFEGMVIWGFGTRAYSLQFLNFGHPPLGGWGQKDPKTSKENLRNHSSDSPLYGKWPTPTKPQYHLGMMFAGWQTPWGYTPPPDPNFPMFEPNFCISGFPGIHDLTIWWQVGIKVNGKWKTSNRLATTVLKL